MMFKRLREYFFPFLVALSAFSLAGAAAFFSVTGLSKLFGGAQEAVIIMASSLEFSKLVTASFLHRYWKTIDWKLKTYLTIGTVTIMFITSAGIYGFLSSAYSETSNKLDNIDGQIELVNQKKQVVSDDIGRLEVNQELKQSRIQSLITLRTQQEARVDSLYNRGRANIAKRVENQIDQSSLEITKTTKESDDLSQKIQEKNNELAIFETEILELKNNDIAGEVGPLKYIAKLTGYSMDSVVNFFILLLIFVFDPMAVCLIIATNITLERVGIKTLADIIPRKNKEDEEKEEPISDELIIEEPIVEEPIVEEPIIEEPIAEELIVEELIVKEPIAEGSIVEEPIVEEEPLSKKEYRTNEIGEFIEQKPEESLSLDEAVHILSSIQNEGIETNEKYQIFLDALYLNGSLILGETLPTYTRLTEELDARGIQYDEKEIIDFLTICNLLKVTDMDGLERKVAKEYSVAKAIFKVLSSK